jgi:hypothetical protein
LQVSVPGAEGYSAVPNWGVESLISISGGGIEN